MSRVRCGYGGPGAAPVLSRLPLVLFLFLFFFFFFFFFLGRFRFKWKQGTVRSGLITVLRTVRSDCGSHESLFFSHRVVLEAKRTAKMSSSRFSLSDSMVRFGFQNLAIKVAVGS